MAIWDIFKKNNDKKAQEGQGAPNIAKPAQAPSPKAEIPAAPVSPAPAPAAPVSPAPAPAAPVSPKPVPEAPVSKPVSDTPPATKPPFRPANKPAQYGNAARPSAVWPRFGDTAANLLGSQQIRVFIDSSFVKNAAFQEFAKVWRDGKASGKAPATRFYYIAAFEKSRLSDEECALLCADDFRERAGNTADECFAQMVEQGLKWNIVWLTANAQHGISMQKAANDKGLLLRWYGFDNENKLCTIQRPANAPKPDRAAANTAKKLFAPASEPVKFARTANPVGVVPTLGERVFAGKDGTAYTLEKALMTDHSSITYKTGNPSYFAKVYTARMLGLDMLENKAKRMLAETVDIPGVCWPCDILTNSSGAFVGILVPASRGVQLTRSVLNGSAGLSQSFPQWDKCDLCTLVETVLRKICRMHELGIYFGCLNPASVYVAGCDEVYFVDTDTWQIEGYPAMSQNQTFTPPERIREASAKLLYTSDEENYQIALLTFMLMMPGKYAYAKNKTTDDRESIASMAFPFSVGEGMRRSDEAERPSGIWRIVWDHLSYRLCFAFYNTFHANGKFSQPGKRLADTAWLEMVTEYKTNLEQPERADSRALFPRTFRRDGKRNFVRCSICGVEHPDSYFLRSVTLDKTMVNLWERGYRICLPCANDASSVKFKCETCGREFFYTNRTKIVHEIGEKDFDWHVQRWCRNCKKRTVKCTRCGTETPIYRMREFEDRQRNLKTTVCQNCFGELINEAKRYKDSAYMTQRCRDCGRMFTITNGEADSLRQKGFNLPTRCPDCRKRRS